MLMAMLLLMMSLLLLEKINKVNICGKKMGITSLISYFSSPNYFKSVDVSNIGGIYANKIRIIAEGNIKIQMKLSLED